MFDITGLLSFSNFLFVISVLMIIAACMWLFRIYLLQILLLMSLEVIELILYGSFGYAIYKTPDVFGSEQGYIWGFCFAAGLTATTLITGLRTKSGNVDLFNFGNMMIHAIVSVYLKSSLIAATSVMFLMCFIGFSIGMGPGFVAFGYKDKDVISSATLASGIVTAIGTFLHIKLTEHLENGIPFTPFLRYAQLFTPGMVWFPPFVFFLSLLIVSSKYYSQHVYVNNNIIAIGLYLVAVLLGNLYNISQITGFSGTFFVLYLCQKYFEIMPNKKEWWAWTLLIIGITLYVVNMYYRTTFEEYGLHAYFNLVPKFEVLSIGN